MTLTVGQINVLRNAIEYAIQLMELDLVAATPQQRPVIRLALDNTRDALAAFDREYPQRTFPTEVR